jgi:hypothetical protein
MDYGDIKWLYMGCLLWKRRYKLVNGELYFHYQTATKLCMSYCISADTIGPYIMERS